MNTNPTVVEVTTDKLVVAKLRKRIHLPPDIYKDTLEERFLYKSTSFYPPVEEAIKVWTQNYNHGNGWTVVWMESRYAIMRSKQVEIIKRRHKLGNFILFRIWRDGERQV